MIISLAFLLVCPGAATVLLGGAALRQIRQPLGRLELFVLAIALSLSIDTLVAKAFFLTHSFSTEGALVVLASLTSIAALCPVGGGPARARILEQCPPSRTVPMKEPP